jgi:transposase
MGNEGNRPNWQEVRRIQATTLKRRGWTQVKIAEALGVTEAAVSKWFRKFETDGEQALRSVPHQGAPSRLTHKQKLKLLVLLRPGAEVHGFRGDVWTCGRIGKMIERHFGVTYHKHHVAKILKDLNWSPHKAIVRATQRDEEEIARWRTVVWPDLKKSPEGA